MGIGQGTKHKNPCPHETYILDRETDYKQETSDKKKPKAQKCM